MTPTDLNLRHVRAFIEVVARGSLSKAALHVHLSQPALTQAIAKLEQRLCAPLLKRRSSGVEVTDLGRLFELRANRGLAILEQGAKLASSRGTIRRGVGFNEFDRLVTTAQLVALIAVAELGNFSLAARRIGVAQPTVHKLARNLEQIAGVPLFIATSHGIDCTPAAEVLSRYASLLFAELAQGIDELEAAQGIDRSSIRIGALPLTRTSVLPAAINALTRQRPAARVAVSDGAYDELLRMLRRGDLDLIAGALRDPVPINDVVQTPLFADRLAVVVRARHPLTDVKTITVSALAAYPWVAPKQGAPARTHFNRLFAEAGTLEPTGLIEASSMVLIRGLLIGSDRLTLLSALQVSHEIAAGTLVALPFALPSTERPIGITVRRDWRPTATQSLFLELLQLATSKVSPHD